MTSRLDLLLVEDNPVDAALILRHLSRAGFDYDCTRVDNQEDLSAALQRQRWAAVLCDFSMPGFGADAVLETVKRAGLDLPFIVVSGEVSDEIVVRMMRSGAHDFVGKDNLGRLAPALSRELAEARKRESDRVSGHRNAHTQ